MKPGKKSLNIFLIAISVLLVCGTVTIFLYGEKKLKEQKRKKVTGAREVIVMEGDNGSNSDKSSESEDSTYSKSEEEASSQPVKKNKFEGMPLMYNDKGFPVLMYHSIDREVDASGKLNELRVPKEVFKEQMEYLKKNDYITLTLDEINNFFENNVPIPEKSIAITFDDGYVDNYTNAYPILKELGFNASVFVITNLIDRDPAYMTSEQLKELEANGIEIQNHTMNHPQLPSLSYENQMKEIKDAKEFLENLLNKKVEYIAYPYGAYNQDTLNIVKELGFKSAYLADGPWAYKKNGSYLYNRVYISSLKDMDNFKERIANPNYAR